MKIICAWCKAVLFDDGFANRGLRFDSHGICGECFVDCFVSDADWSHYEI
jgi:hypothetical protein